MGFGYAGVTQLGLQQRTECALDVGNPFDKLAETNKTMKTTIGFIVGILVVVKCKCVSSVQNQLMNCLTHLVAFIWLHPLTSYK